MKKVLIKIFLFLAITNSVYASYLRSAGKYIFTSEGEKIILKGMGLGGWLVREGYASNSRLWISYRYRK